jgi:hypothetical protein
MTTKDVIGHLIIQMPSQYSGVVARRSCPGVLATRIQRAAIDNTTHKIPASTIAAATGLAA